MAGLLEPVLDPEQEFEERLERARQLEAQSPVTVDPESRIVWTPQDGFQVDFLQCPIFELLGHGTRGGGKTDVLLMDFAQHVGQGFGADWRGILFRETYPQLADVVAKSEKWFRQIFPDAKFNRSKMQWEWRTGEMLMFRHMARPSDYWGYHGHSYPWVAFEELCTWATDECYKLMFACCRSTNPKVPRKIRSTTNPYGCIPYGEVLTGRGWVDIREVVAGDSVVSVRSDGVAANAIVSRAHRQHFDGTMIGREGAGLSMAFTEDHRLPLLSRNRSRHYLEHFHDLPGQADIRRTASAWIGEECEQILGHDAGDFCELVGWFLSEGCVIRNIRSKRNEFAISQMKIPNRIRIASLLGRLGVRFRADFQSFTVSDAVLRGYFNQQGYSYEKFVPRELLGLSARLLGRLFESLMLGDGDSAGHYYTLSPRLADDVAEIATKLGRSVFVTSRHRANRKRPCYEVLTASRATVQLATGNHIYAVASRCASVNVTREHFVGDVYCLTVPGTETFFVRQNGCVWLSGNSGHNWVMSRFQLQGQWWKTIVIPNPKDFDGRPEPPRASVHSHIDENQILLKADPHYKTTINASASNKAMAQAWLDGSWDLIAGGMFDDVWDPNSNLVSDFNVPSSWRIDRAFDWGSSKPFSVGWYAVSDGSDLLLKNGKMKATVRGDLFRIGEWYGWTGKANEGLRMLAVDVAKGIVEREVLRGWRTPRGTRVFPGPADSSIYTVENGNCIANDMDKPVRLDGNQIYHGVTFIPSDKRPGSRKMGWEMMRKMIRNARSKSGTARERPGLFVVAAQCPQFLRTVLSLPRDPKDLDDADSSAEDHVSDEARYRCRAVGTEVTGGRTVGMY